MRIAAGCEGSGESGCCADVARCWSAGMNTCTTAAECGGFTCAGERTFSSPRYTDNALSVLVEKRSADSASTSATTRA